MNILEENYFYKNKEEIIYVFEDMDDSYTYLSKENESDNITYCQDDKDFFDEGYDKYKPTSQEFKLFLNSDYPSGYFMTMEESVE